MFLPLFTTSASSGLSEFSAFPPAGSKSNPSRRPPYLGILKEGCYCTLTMSFSGSIFPFRAAASTGLDLRWIAKSLPPAFFHNAADFSPFYKRSSDLTTWRPIPWEAYPFVSPFFCPPPWPALLCRFLPGSPDNRPPHPCWAPGSGRTTHFPQVTSLFSGSGSPLAQAVLFLMLRCPNASPIST